MGSVRPFTDAHAIVGVDFAIMLNQNLAKHQAASIQKALIHTLATKGYDAELDSAKNDGEDLICTFQKKDADGHVAEYLHVHNKFVHVVIREYRGWQVTRDTALDTLTPILDFAKTKKLKLSGIGVAFRDAFIFENPNAFRADEILRPNQFIPAILLDKGGDEWHCSLFWEDKIKSKLWTRLYSQVTFDAGFKLRKKSVPKKRIHVTEINHKQHVLLIEEKSGRPMPWSEELTRSRLDAMHEKNKQFMSIILSEDMTKAIGLKE